MHQYFVYILASKRNGTLYIGMTNDISRRAKEHKDGAIEGFTKQYEVNKVVYIEQFQYVNDAIQREKQLKRWKRDWKIRIIEEVNPNWDDLFYEESN